MNRRRFLRQTGLVGAGAVTAAFDFPFREKAPRGDLLIAGSTTLLLYANLIGEAFAKANPDVDLVVEGGGSGAGLIAVRRGAIDIATMSRELSIRENTLDIHNTLIGLTAVVIVVNPENPVTDMTRSQVRQVFAGRLRSWRELGGPDTPINVHGRKEGSSTRKNLEEMVLGGGAEATRGATLHGSAEDMAAAIAGDPRGIGFLTPRDIVAGTRPLALDKVAVDAGNILLGVYPLSEPLFLVQHGEPQGLGAQFVAFALSPPGQQILSSRGIQPVR
jgi:phosphate transport system substrate-binding protein